MGKTKYTDMFTNLDKLRTFAARYSGVNHPYKNSWDNIISAIEKNDFDTANNAYSYYDKTKTTLQWVDTSPAITDELRFEINTFNTGFEKLRRYVAYEKGLQSMDQYSANQAIQNTVTASDNWATFGGGDNVDIDIPNSEMQQDISELFPNLPGKESPYDLAGYVAQNSGNGVGSTIFVLENDSTIKYVTNKFYLQSLNFNLKERAQLLETLGASSISFFGESVRVYTFAGISAEGPSQSFDYKFQYFHQSSLIQMYNDVLRGTKLLENNSIGVLKVANHLIYGYPLALNVAQNANNDNMGQFSMSWVVTAHKLALPGTVSEDNLKMMFKVDGLHASKPYMTNINNLLNAIDNLIVIKNWPSPEYDNVKKAIYPSSTLLGIGSSTFQSWATLSDTSVYKNFITYCKGKIEIICAYLKLPFENTDLNTSPGIRHYFSSKTDVNERMGLLNFNLNNITDSGKPDAYQGAMEMFDTLINIKNDLLIFKARLVY